MSNEIDWSKDDGSEEFAERVVRAAVPSAYAIYGGSVWGAETIPGAVFGAFLGNSWHSTRIYHPTVQEWERANRPMAAGYAIDEEDRDAVAKLLAYAQDNESPTPAPEGERLWVRKQGDPVKAIKWTGDNLAAVREVYPGIPEEYMRDKGAQIGWYVVRPCEGRVYFMPPGDFESEYEPVRAAGAQEVALPSETCTDADRSMARAVLKRRNRQHYFLPKQIQPERSLTYWQRQMLDTLAYTCMKERLLDEARAIIRKQAGRIAELEAKHGT